MSLQCTVYRSIIIYCDVFCLLTACSLLAKEDVERSHQEAAHAATKPATTPFEHLLKGERRYYTFIVLVLRKSLVSQGE